ncbi:MAG: hypothetical protein EOP48_08725 [Sphingobacteriales bacterium]|nr:MAG: hypothetical protein EOP48_08725 [Sphingobacteriales bacterium]
MKLILPALILSLISAVAIAQSPVQRQRQVPAKVKNQPSTEAVSSVGSLAGAGSGAAAASYAATGRAAAVSNPADNSSNSADSTKNELKRRRVEVLKSNKTGDPKAIVVNPLYTPSGNSGENPLFESASKAINQSGVSVKSDSKPKKK